MKLDNIKEIKLIYKDNDFILIPKKYLLKFDLNEYKIYMNNSSWGQGEWSRLFDSFFIKIDGDINKSEILFSSEHVEFKDERSTLLTEKIVNKGKIVAICYINVNNQENFVGLTLLENKDKRNKECQVTTNANADLSISCLTGRSSVQV